ncbi:MAG: hypothetical protein ACJA1E_000023 [Paracoccaceae bacterium]|mgnify:CR=1 FL=1|jgi:hypothetical protein|tara:strand:- start:6297 stop:6665 length:369 start_codon:yes stop_codon:yes gene_type:complete
MQQHDLPEGVGPHEGQEFDLMRKGKKDVALFFELIPEGLDGILKDGCCLLEFPQFEHQGQTIFTRIVFRAGFEVDATRLKEIITDNAKGINPSREHEIGKILSYTPQQVDAYIRHASGNLKP